MNIFKNVFSAFALTVIFLFVFSSALADTDIEDIEPPVIVSATLDPVVINTSDSPVTITLTVRITDNLAGIDRGYYRFTPTNPQISGQFVDAYTDKRDAICTGTSTDMVCRIPFTLPQYSASGNWTPTWMFTKDIIGNRWDESASPPGIAPTTPGYVYFTNDTEGTHFTHHIFLPTVVR